MGSIKKKNGAKKISWFGFTLTKSSAQILFILSLIALLGTVVWLFFLVSGMLNYFSLVGAYTDLTGGYYSYYTNSAAMYYIIYIVLALFLLGIEIYTLNKTKQTK